MWPFKKTPVTTLAEEAAKLPTPPCGDGEKHLWWHVMGGMPCPACRAIEVRAREAAREDRMAEKIAAAVVRQMAAQDKEAPMLTPDQIAERIAVYESKAAWCDENGHPADAAEYRAYVAQMRRQVAAQDKGGAA